MKLLYIKPTPKINSLKSRIRELVYGRDLNSNQEGFFVQSLQQVATVDFVSRDNFFKKDLSRYDAVIINSKATSTGTEADLFREFEFLKKVSLKKALFISNARSSFMPEDNVLDLMDVIFKREPFKDRDVYKISSQNKLKIQKTMLPCPLVKKNNARRLQDNSKHSKNLDIFFNGQATNEVRTNTIKEIKKQFSGFYGGLIPTPGKSIDKEIFFERIGKHAYRELLRRSKINLALEGIGSFTYRHLEILSQSGFLLCSNTIDKLDLPIHLVPGKHYVSYDSLEDMMDKISFYLQHESQRVSIASAGFRQFMEDYDFDKHGRFLIKPLMQA